VIEAIAAAVRQVALSTATLPPSFLETRTCSRAGKYPFQIDDSNHLRQVWGYRSLGRTRTLDSHASRLRRKLARDGAALYVVKVWRVGYKLLDG
jgi:hypothetical protein